jgi:ribosomal protein L15
MTHKFQSWDSVALETMIDLISRKVVTGEKAMVARVFLKKRRGAGDSGARGRALRKGRQASKQLKRVFSP